MMCALHMWAEFLSQTAFVQTLLMKFCRCVIYHPSTLQLCTTVHFSGSPRLACLGSIWGGLEKVLNMSPFNDKHISKVSGAKF